MHGHAQQSETQRHPNRLPPGLCRSARCRIRVVQTFPQFRADCQEPVTTRPCIGMFSHLLNSGLKIQWTDCWTGGTMNTTEGPESCADLLLSKWHALLAPCPIVKCTLASPPLDAGIPCVQQGGRKKQGTFCWVTFIPVILNTREAATFVSWFSSFFSPLTYCVWGGCVCYYKVYWNINIYF